MYFPMDILQRFLCYFTYAIGTFLIWSFPDNGTIKFKKKCIESSYFVKQLYFQTHENAVEMVKIQTL